MNVKKDIIIMYFRIDEGKNSIENREINRKNNYTTLLMDVMLKIYVKEREN